MSKIAKLVDDMLNAKVDEALAPALKVAVAKNAEAKQNALQGQLVKILEDVDHNTQEAVAIVRQYKKNLEVARKRLESIVEAGEHFRKTGNPLPFFKLIGSYRPIADFCNSIGISVPDENDSAWKLS